MESIRRAALVCAMVVGCGGGNAAPPGEPKPVPPPPPTAEVVVDAAVAMAVDAGGADGGKEAQEAREAKELAEDRAKWEAANKAELGRWTPDLHAQAKALAARTFATGKQAIEAAAAGKHRKPGNADRDKYRHPLETLEFFGFKPTMAVVDIGPGDGWYTELLAPALAAKGKYAGTSTGDPNGPLDKRSTFYAQRWKAFVDKAPEIYGKVRTLHVDPKNPSLGPDGSADLVLIMREVHGMVSGGTLDGWLAAVKRVLGPHGVLGIEEHRAPDGADPKESSKKGYVPEKWLVERVEAAGFKLAGKSEINANPKDTKDYDEGVWTLPPTLTLGDKDRDKYLAIGESDRMTLEFVLAK